MPYVDTESRDRLSDGAWPRPRTAGELNYCFTVLAVEYLTEAPESGYSRMNEVIGAFEAAKLEFYRRVVAPYEERKRSENGDVY